VAAAGPTARQILGRSLGQRNPGDDVLFGTTGPDTIYGLGGTT
jgi:hypothetical protein